MKFANALKLNVLAAALIAATLSVGDAHAQRGKDKDKVEEAYPDATRESPEAKNTPRLAKDIQKMFDLYNEGEDMEGAIAIAEKLLANDRATQGLGMRIVAMGPGHATLEMQVRDDMLNGFGTCHGGFITTLADSAFAFACTARNQRTVASGLSIDFLAPARKGDLCGQPALCLHGGGARRGDDPDRTAEPLQCARLLSEQHGTCGGYHPRGSRAQPAPDV